MKKLSVLLALALLVSILAGLNVVTAESTAYEPVEITFLHCWNGGGSSIPDDQVDNPVAKTLREKTGVTFKMESIVTSEYETLNTMFASGVMPDLVNAPHWSTTSGEGFVIKEAASQGMMYDISGILDNYPNVKKLFEVGIASDYLKFDIYNPAYNGAIYIIPQQTPTFDSATITNWCYGVYARGDILESLGVDPKTITSAEALYDLAVKIRDGGFLDATGKAVIPMGTWHNGWSYSEFTDSFSTGYYLTSYRLLDDGSVTMYQFTDEAVNRTLFMRKLVSEGLIDVECFSQTDTMAKEKMAVGKIAIFGAQDMVGSLKDTLYATNPEMQFELLGPMINQEGNIVTQVEKAGRSGTPVMFIAASVSDDKANAILRALDYLNSEDGHLLITYGLEGEQFYYDDNGMPKYIPELKAQMDADSNVKRNLGLDFYANFIGADDRTVKWPKAEDEKTQWEKLQDTFKVQLPIVQIQKGSVEYLLRDYEGYADYQDRISTLDWDDEMERAFFAASDEEAMQIIEAARQRYIDAGVNDLLKYLADAYANYSDPSSLAF